jgi:hypothetical protein
LKAEDAASVSEGWFVAGEDDGDRASLSFMWRSQVLLTRLGSNGSPEHEAIQTLNVIDFEFFSTRDRIYMRITDPPRNLRVLMNALEAIAGFGFAVSSVSFDASNPALIFRDMDDIRLVGLKLVNVVLGRDLVGRLELASKNAIDIGNITAMRGLSYQVDWAAYELIYKGARGYIALSSGGTTKVGGQLAPRLLNHLERALTRTKRATVTAHGD